MALGWKLVVDAGDPHRQAAFWAEALGYQIEDNSTLIERLLAAGTVEQSLCVEFQGRLFWRDAAAVRHPDDPFDPVSGTGLGRRLLFNRVPEPKAGKNRLHVDVHADRGQRDATVARLRAHGATLVRHVKEPGGEWSVLTDPEGNEFCVS
ncbi:VOC family protein [Micromonospora eburnea]|uniref:Glyoxalase-like domain-containing protein n=1 Tax=Micromonospora eburnea TaxID=227316 RepID=A0A1C6UKS0_9ACTN|nr:VOC family protein [Micromonospora eburnea]SCL54551.1 Glyoxalase-like domain-containing protein [Micromonospora eburnea]